jgi:hypothetical protein
MAPASEELVLLPSAKRKRTANTQEMPVITRGDVYFEDGNIILAVQQTHFRVYRGVLSVLSPTLAEKFTKLQGCKAEMLVDGCPVLELDDLAEDWCTLLKAIFQG